MTQASTTSLDRSALIARLRAALPALRQIGATGVYLFGSRARGDH